MPVISDRTRDGSDSNQRGDKRGVTFADHVPAGATQKLTYTVDKDATIERIEARIYEGPQLDLQLEMYVVQRADEGHTDLVRSVGKDYIDGDDDHYRFSPTFPVESEDKIVIRATNNDGSNAYDYRINMDLDYAGGLDRATTWLQEVLL